MTDVSTIIDDSRGFAEDSLNEASSLIADAQTALAYQPFYENELERPDLDDVTPATVEVPELPGLSVPSAGIFPEVPTFLEPTTVEKPVFPTAPDALDTSGLFQQTSPSDVHEFTDTVPDIDASVLLPDTPDFTTVELPDLYEMDLPDKPTIALPGFDIVKPTFLGELPDGFEDKFEDTFNTILPEFRAALDGDLDAFLAKHFPDHQANLQGLEDHLAGVIAGSNTAWDDNVEAQIFDRARQRTGDEAARAYTQASEGAARRGMVIPDGAIFGALIQMEMNTARANSETATEIAVKRMEREAQHLEFALQQMSFLRQFAMRSAIEWALGLNKVNDQAMAYARSALENTVQLFNLQVERYRADVAMYQAEARVLETQIQVALADLEVYKAELEGERIKSSINGALVDQYRAQIQGQVALVDQYRARLAAIAQEVEIRKVPLDIFRARVDAYQGYVRGKTAQLGAYTAALQGDREKVNAYVAEVGAYRAEVDATKTVLDAETAVLNAQNLYNSSLRDQFKAQSDAVIAEMGLNRQELSANVEVFRAKMDEYSTKARIELARYQGELEKEITDARLDMEYGVRQADFITKIANNDLLRHRAIADVAMAGARAHGDMAASALSAQNTLVSQVEQITS